MELPNYSWYPKTNMTIRSSHQRCSIRKGVLKNFTKFTGKHLRQSLFFEKVAGLRAATLLKKKLWHRCFPVNFVKFSRTTFLQNTFGRLLLDDTVHLTRLLLEALLYAYVKNVCFLPLFNECLNNLHFACFYFHFP